ncbi:hypothetical protein C8R47DRAFT_1215661 [Mycena vitilis]|nr:hypothetical protein C8R47DRAFT_1215661 [Mycena vitilis]
MADMGDGIAAVAAAADTVLNAHATVSATFSSVVLAPAPAASTAPAQANGFVRLTGPWIAGRVYSVIPTANLASVADNGGKWFSITRGKYIGLTQNSAVALTAVTGISTGLMQKFSNQTDALNNFNSALASGALAVVW